jgi:hypothetical protein
MRPFRCPPLIDDRLALMLLYNNVAEKRQHYGLKDFGSTFGKCGTFDTFRKSPLSPMGWILGVRQIKRVWL